MEIFRKIYWRIKFFVTGGVTGYEKKLIINFGINAHSDKEATEQMKEIEKEVKAKLGSYLEHWSCFIEIK